MSKINFLPLGGMDERGKNCYVLEVDNNIYIFNAGVTTPPSVLLGIKQAVADFSYLEKNKSKIQGIFIGEPSFMNIGGLHFLLTKIGTHTPIFTSLVGKVIIETYFEKRFRNINIKPNLVILKELEKSKIGNFEITPFKIFNSLPSSFGWVVHTPDGGIVYADNFIVSYDRNKTFESQLHLVNQITNNKTLLLLAPAGQAGNVHGYTAPQHKSKDFYERMISNSDGRIIIACYDYDAYTILTLAQVAKQHQRPFIIYSNTFINTFTLLNRNKMFSNKNLITLPLSEISKSKNAIVIITGTKDQLFHKVQRIVDGEDDKVQFRQGDTFILGTTLVPGYEGYAARLLDGVSRHDVRLEKLPKTILPLIPSAEDLKMFVGTVNPKYVIPTSGLYKALIQSEDAMIQANIRKSQIMVLGNGEMITINNGEMNKKPITIKLDEKYIGAQGALDVGASILYERNQMAESGIVTLTVLYNPKERKFYNFKINKIGVINDNEQNPKLTSNIIERLENELADLAVYDSKKNRLDIRETKIIVKKMIAKYFEKSTGKRPLVLPTIVEIRN